ncbi:MAG: hypothetical protein ABFS86_18505, partial [Planctomycetota bacterium]
LALSVPAAAAPELALHTGADGRKNVVVKTAAGPVALTDFTRPTHIYDFAPSPDGNHAFVWHMDVPPRTISVYDLASRERTASFRPGVGGSLRWTAANTLLHIWRAGTAFHLFHIYDRRGKVLRGATAESLAVSPTVRFLAGRPDIVGRERLRVWDLATNRLVIDRPTEGGPWFSFDLRWEGDHTLHLLYADEERKTTKDVSLDLRPPLELSVLGQSLFLRDGNEDRVLLRAVPPAEGRSSAEVRRVHSVVTAPGDRAAAVFLSRNRQKLLLPARLDGEGEPVFGTAVPVPDACHASFSPRGDAILLVSTRDGYLPCDATFKLNRGAMLLRLGAVEWRPSIEAALRAEGKGPWYGRPADRFVPDGDFEVVGVRWTDRGCVLRTKAAGGAERTVTLR